MSAEVLEIGFVARAHGLKGELGVRCFDAESDALFEVKRLRLRRKDGSEDAYVVKAVRPTPKEVLVVVEGVNSRTEAERLVGAAVLVLRDDLPPPEEGEFFQGDLLGLQAFDEEGKALGSVAELWSHGEVPNLVIRAEGRPASEELIVPFADDFVVDVDLAQRRIVIRPPQFTD